MKTHLRHEDNMCQCGCELVQSKVALLCKQSNEYWGYIEGEYFVDYLIQCRFLDKVYFRGAQIPGLRSQWRIKLRKEALNVCISTARNVDRGANNCKAIPRVLENLCTPELVNKLLRLYTGLL